MRDHTVESTPVALVDIKTFVEKLSQETSILRWAVGIGIPRPDRPGLLVFDRRCHVAQSREPKPGNDGTLRLVAHLVDVPWLIAILEIKRGDVRNNYPVFHPPKLPLLARNGPRRTEKPVTHGERVAGACRINWRIACGIGIAPHVIKRVGRVGGVRREYCRDPTGDGLPLFERRCCIERHKPAATRYIELPSDPYKGVALAHEEAVAEIGLVGWIGHLRSAVELLDDIFAPAIEDIEQCDAVAARHVLRSNHIEIGRKGYMPRGITGGFLDIDDGDVAGMRGIDRKVDLANDFLVGPHGAKRLAAQNVRTCSNLDTSHFRMRAEI